MKKDHLEEIYKLFSSIKTPKQAEKLLKDILTPGELEQLTERWQIIKMLNEGTPQREIAKRLGLSISKITRGSNALKYGNGGFKLFLNNET